MKKLLFPSIRSIFRSRPAGPLALILLIALLPVALVFDLAIFLPVFLLAALCKGARALAKKAARRRYLNRLALEDIASGYEFELYVANLLKQNGFVNVGITGASGDYGADVIAEKDGLGYAVQCKFYSRPVGNKAVQEAHAAKQYYDCDEAVVVTNSTFTQNAVALAEATGTQLWGRDELYAMNARRR